jgi:Domain of unknown function (DUF6379)
MLEQDVIQTRGFRNTRDGDQITGFRLQIRTPYYRGMWASLIEGADVTVDGERFAREGTTWTIAGRTYTVAELAEAGDDHWAFDQPATLTVHKPGGLEPGLHDLEVAIVWRMSYMPIEMQPTTYTARRKVTLVR